VAEEGANFLKVVMLLEDLHRDAVAEVMGFEFRISDQPPVYLA